MDCGGWQECGRRFLRSPPFLSGSAAWPRGGRPGYRRVAADGVRADAGRRYEKKQPAEFADCFWRRGRDSNSWYGFTPYVGLANRWFQPLTHLSGQPFPTLSGFPHEARRRHALSKGCANIASFRENAKKTDENSPISVDRSRAESVFRAERRLRCVGRNDLELRMLRDDSDAPVPPDGRYDLRSGRGVGPVIRSRSAIQSYSAILSRCRAADFGAAFAAHRCAWRTILLFSALPRYSASAKSSLWVAPALDFSYL